MHRFLYILGALTLVALATVVIAIGVIAYRGTALDAESKAFVDSAVPAITASWSQEQLVKRATPELRQSVKPDQLATFFGTLSRLGPLVQYEGATGEATMSYFSASGGTVSASYVANARFENGNATFRIALLKRDGQWMIHNFHVDPVVGDKPRQAL
jgi:hypothetical protein